MLGIEIPGPVVRQVTLEREDAAGQGPVQFQAWNADGVADFAVTERRIQVVIVGVYGAKRDALGWRGGTAAEPGGGVVAVGQDSKLGCDARGQERIVGGNGDGRCPGAA